MSESDDPDEECAIGAAGGRAGAALGFAFALALALAFGAAAAARAYPLSRISPENIASRTLRYLDKKTHATCRSGVCDLNVSLCRWTGGTRYLFLFAIEFARATSSGRCRGATRSV